MIIYFIKPEVQILNPECYYYSSCTKVKMVEIDGRKYKIFDDFIVSEGCRKCLENAKENNVGYIEISD